jgi:proteasome lid subunit RPN8/RPN11
MKLRRSELDAMMRHAASGYPFEVCGVLVGTDAADQRRVLEVIPVVNRETETPRVRYQIAPEDLIRIQREARERGREILGYFHSHPDHPPRPSETDRRIAAEGLSDGVVHVVVATHAQGATAAHAWIFRDTLQGFAEEPLEVD